jgi:hypothetical protein
MHPAEYAGGHGMRIATPGAAQQDGAAGASPN